MGHVFKSHQKYLHILSHLTYFDYRMNRAAQHACDKDAKDKHHAQGLDDRMHQLRNGSQGIGFHPGIENVDNTYVIIRYTRYAKEVLINHLKVLHYNLFLQSGSPSRNPGSDSPRRTLQDLRKNERSARDYEGRSTHCCELVPTRCGATSTLSTMLWTHEYNRPLMLRTNSRLIWLG